MWSLTPALFAMVVGCAESTPQAASPGDVATTTAATGEEDPSATELREHHRHHHHGGFAMFIAMSLESIGATPEQEAKIKAIRDDLHAKTEPAHEAEKAVLVILADGIAAGTIDTAKVDAAIAQVTTAASGVHDAVADSLNQLHDVLTPEQRAALVGKVEAHLEVWAKVNAEQETADNDVRTGHLDHLAKELALSTDQAEKIRTAIAGRGHHFDPAKAQEHMRAFGAAFTADKFDSKSLTTGGPANAHVATWGITRTAHFYEAVTPVLTPDQRTKLADLVRKHANYQRSGT